MQRLQQIDGDDAQSDDQQHPNGNGGNSFDQFFVETLLLAVNVGGKHVVVVPVICAIRQNLLLRFGVGGRLFLFAAVFAPPGSGRLMPCADKTVI